jgi:ATP-binding cassette subfamily B protein
LLIDLLVHGINDTGFRFQEFYFLIGMRVLTLFAQDVSFSLQNYLDILLWTKFPTHLYHIVLSKLSDLDVQYFEDSSFKDRLEKVRESYAWKPLNMLSSLFFGFQSLIQFLIALFAIATLNWFLMILILLVVVPSFIIQTRYAKLTWSIWNENSPYRKKFWYLSDMIQNGQSVKEIKIFQIAQIFLSELKDIYKSFVTENSKVAKRKFRINIILNFFGILVYGGTEVFILLSALTKRLSIGDISYYTSVLTNFQNGANGLFRNASQLYDQGLYVREMFEVLDIKPKITQLHTPVIPDIHKAPAIVFNNVSFKYPGSEQYILRHFSLTIKPGQKVAFVGENGAGKTTIVKLLARFYDVDQGEILIDGVNIKDLDLSVWYKALGVLFQDFIRYEYPLRENIYFGKVYEPEITADIMRAATLAGADTVADELPKKYEQMLGKVFADGIELSAGQWQKVALARAFYRNSPVLILDEPTASIDAKAESEIFENVGKLTRDKTVLIISHRFSTVRNADVIYVIEKGKIKESGSHEALMKQKGTYAELFTLQAKGYK